MGLGNVAPRALVTGLGVLGNVLSKPFVNPARDRIGIEAMQNQMRHLMPQRVVTKLVGRVPLNEQTAGRVNSAGPLFQLAGGLELLPLVWILKNVNMTLWAGGRLLSLQFPGDYAIIKLRFDRDRSRDIGVREMIDEVVAFAVFPLFGLNRESFFA